MGLIKFLIVTILILWLIRMLVRLIFPLLLKNMVNKMQGQATQSRYNPNQRQESKKPEGSISIDYMPPQAKTGKTDKLGDFVEYEEVKP